MKPLSIDYLLGNANSADDYTERYIHDFTGLSNYAIRVFKEMSETEHDVFNKLADEDGLLRLLLLELWNYANI